MGMLLVNLIIGLIRSEAEGDVKSVNIPSSTQQSNISQQQPFSYAKITYKDKATNVVAEGKEAGFNIRYDPLSFVTQIKGERHAGFKAGFIIIYLFGNKELTEVSKNSTYNIKRSAGLDLAAPKEFENASDAIVYTVADGTKQFSIEIMQDPFITVDGSDDERLFISSINLPVIPETPVNYILNEPIDSVLTSLFKATAPFYPNLLINSVSAFKTHMNDALIDCSDKIGDDLKKIRLICILQKVHIAISEVCTPLEVCMEQVKCAEPEKPVEPMYPKPISNWCKPSFYLDICFKASIICEIMFNYGGQPGCLLNPADSFSHGKYIGGCDKVLYRRKCASITKVSQSTIKGACTTKTNTNKIAAKKGKKNNKKEKDEKKEGMSNGVKIAGGCVIVVVVSVCCYGAYSVLA